MPKHMIMFISFVLTIAVVPETGATVKYNITNTAAETSGGVRYENQIGFEYSKHTLKSSNLFIWRIFQQKNKADRANVTLVHLFIDDMDGVAYCEDNEIHVSTNYIAGYQDDLKKEFSGVVYHEMTHVWQWNGNDSAPQGLIEGIADFVRLKAGYIPSHWVQPGQGDQWDQGYDVTARFLDHCEGLRNGFVAQLNKKMQYGYSVDYFVDLVGKTVDLLWSEYKAAYNG
ncbi:uncharacterized protein LOC112516717 [Cynara cardunculus var. scolymus]|uniref:Uncharacterized protein family, basic secretory protein n=1 Tax=Cynara cardunculus var. scolymus TaxID=59895 RepID=A0A103XMP2_CYNCS|nr:uncharacterized protein LOC112516717 [Cynara cardunculus var. scolymus]KVH93329.1 Uncharacterized protein family, basic secretory protein [Cynara cardunculus var. scolymus]